MAWFYFTTQDRISVRYKHDSCRNTLDVYGSSRPRSQQVDNVGTVQHTSQEQHKQQSPLKPVILFLPGGAFTIGYKLWAALMAQALVPAGLLIVVADYRNYPWGDVPAMLHDADDALRWTAQHCQRLGGNPQQIILVGQSAGAHLGLMTVLRHAATAAAAVTTTSSTADTTPQNEPPTQQIPNIKGFVGLSGVYDMKQLIQLCDNHAIPPTFVTERLLGNRRHDCDPTEWLSQQRLLPSAARLSFPPIELWHGTADRTVDWRCSQEFASKLRQFACDKELNKNTTVHFKAYPLWTHTDAIIEAIFEGDHSFHHDLCRCIEMWCDVRIDFQPPPSSPRCPRLLVQLARKASPF